MSSLPILRGPDRPDLLRHEILADVFEATAARVPGNTALMFGATHLSCAELDAAADLAAHRLIEAGVRAGDRVGLKGERIPARTRWQGLPAAPGR